MISHQKPDDWTIETVWASETGLELRQTISYSPGDLYVKKRWELTSSASASLSNLRFYHGGDTYFGGYDSSRSWWDPDLRILYLTNSEFSESGIMGVYTNPATPADGFMAGDWEDTVNAVWDGTSLPNAANSDYIDAGYALQWNRSTLAPGETWIIEMFETWTHPLVVQVISPADASAPADATVVQTFKVHNLDDSNRHTFELSVVNSQGWLTRFPQGSAFEVRPLERVSVPVEVIVPSGVPAGVSSVTSISAIVDGGILQENVASTRISIIDADYDISPQTIDFGGVAVDGSADRAVTVTNHGEPLSIAAVGNFDALEPPFSIVVDECSNALLGLGDSCSITVRMAPSSVGAAGDSFNIPVVAPATASYAITVTGTGVVVPSGHGVSFDRALFTVAHATNASFSFSNAEVGADYHYQITSSGGGTPVTGSGTITSPNQTISNIDLRSLEDGTLTLSAVLANDAGEADAVTDTADLDATPPTGYGVTFDYPAFNAVTASSASFEILQGEFGAAFTYSISSSGGGIPVTGSGTIEDEAAQAVSSVDLRALADGVLTLSVTLTDAVGNEGQPATAAAVLDTTPPSMPPAPDLDPASDSGVSSTDNITSVLQPKLNGTAEPGATIEVFSDVDGFLGSTTADGAGNWSLVSSVPLSEGVHGITAIAADAAGNLSPSSAALTVIIDVTPPNAADDEADTNEDESVQIAVLANDADAVSSLNPASVRIVQAPEHGSASVNTGTGIITFTPDENFNGTDVFYYAVDDLLGSTSQARVTVTVHPVNDPPAAVNDAVSTDEDEPTYIDVLANDADVDGPDEIDPSSLAVVSGPKHGTAEVVSGMILYTPDLDFYGTDELTYTVRDYAGAVSNEAFVIINVAGINDAPRATDDIALTKEDEPVEIFVLANDYDIDSMIDRTTVRVVDDPDHGMATVNAATGTITYTPAPDYYGEDEFTYVVRDEEGATSAPARVSITIESVNDPPVAVDDTAVLLEDTAHVVNVLGNDTDVDNAIRPETVDIVSPPQHGTAAVNPVIGVITYTPGENFFGEDTLTYRVQDEDGAWSNVATVYFTVESVNDAPLANDDSATTDEDQPVTIAVLANDEDIDGYLDPQSVTVVRAPSHGEVHVELDGTILYVPDPDWNGEDSFSYTVSDDELGVSNEATVWISVLPVNDAPTIEGTPTTVVDAGEPYSFAPVIADVEGDALTVSAVNLPEWLTLDSETGVLHGTPLAMHVGTYSGIVLRVSDGEASTALPAFDIHVHGVLDSDMDGMPDEYELEHGFDPFDPSDALADADQDGVPNVDEFEAGTNPLVDDYAPRLSVPSVVELDATGLLTPFPALVAPTAFDDRDGELSPVLSGDAPYLPPGAHTVTWTVVDSAGNEAQVTQRVLLHPQISLGRDQVRAEGSTVSVTFHLNGESPAYPVVVEYAIGGTATVGVDHDLLPGSVVFEEGEAEKRVDFTIFADDIVEGPETIEVSLVGSGNFGARSSQVVTIVEENVAPRASLTVGQGSRPARLLTMDGGAVLFSAEIDDPNPQDQHVIEWSFPAAAAIVDMGDTLKALDPMSLQPGVYEVRLVVRDDGMPPLETEVIESFRVVAAAPMLASDLDSDGDGIPDADEGYGDADGDGIPDYLDAISQLNVLAERADDGGLFLIEADPGVRLVLGDSAQLLGGAGAAIPEDEVGEVDIESDSITNVGGYFDFVVREIPTAGASISIVIPQRAGIPTQPVYRKYNGSWFTFVEDARNHLASAPGEPGVCPPPGSDDYQPGLTPGHWCVELTIEDGGPNDADGLVNGAIRDPGGVGTIGQISYTTGGGGGGGGAFGWQSILGLFVFAACRKLYRRRCGARSWPTSTRHRGARRVRRVSRAACAALAAVMAFAHPIAYADRGFDRGSLYVAARLGFADTGISRFDLESDFAARGINATVTAVDEERATFEIAAGYAVSKRWAVEAGYLDLGEVKVSFDAPQLAEGLAYVHPSSGDGYVVSGLYRQPLLERVELLARVGVFDWEAAYATENEETRIDRARIDGRDWLLGLGAEYSFAPTWALIGEVRQYHLPRKPTREMTLGVRWYVGRRP